MENNIDSISSKAEIKKRPPFLNVLCILSFIGIGYTVLNNIIGAIFISSGFLEKVEEMLYNLPEEEPIMMLEKLGYFDMIHTFATNGLTMTLISIIGALVCLVGVLQMWKYKKTGYYIYFVGEIGVPLITAFLLGASSPILMMIAVMMFVFPIAFVIMYGFNLKHLE